jgi:Domain of unknown function (DUF397)
MIGQIPDKAGKSVNITYLNQRTDDAEPLRHSRWRKSSRSIGDGECVEVTSTSGRVAVRDSKNLGKEMLVFPVSQWRLFIEQYKHR